MPVYDDAALGLMRDIFFGQENLPASDALTVELWNGDPDDSGSMVASERVDLPWLLTQIASREVRADNPAVISIGPAETGGWSVTHLRVQSGPVDSEVPLWKSETAGGTLTVPEDWYANIPASVIWSLLTWSWGDSGGGAAPHIKPSMIVLSHAIGGTNEIRSGSDTFTVEFWDHDPLHTSHGSPLDTVTVDRDDTKWTETEGPPVSMENTDAIESAEAPEDGWDWQYTTIRITGGTAFLWKSSIGATSVAEGGTAVIAAGAVVFTLTAT